MRHPREAEKNNKRSSNSEKKNKDNSNVQSTTNYLSNQNIIINNNNSSSSRMSNETKSKPLAAGMGTITLTGTLTETQDKRLQEMREFALEYVKQIVLKANELSHERYEVKKACQVQKQMEDVTKYNLNSNNKVNFQVSFNDADDGNEKQKQDSTIDSSVFLTQIEATDAISKRLEFEASKINKRFKLFANREEEEEEANNKQQKRIKGSKQIHYEKSNNKIGAEEKISGNGANDNLQQSHQEIVRNYQNASFKAAEEQNQYLGNSSQQAYIESGSILRNSQQQQQQQQQRQKEKNQQHQHQEKRSKRGFYHRLNWHLIVACFSTCLPQSMTETVPSSMSTGGASSGGSASATAV